MKLPILDHVWLMKTAISWGLTEQIHVLRHCLLPWTSVTSFTKGGGWNTWFLWSISWSLNLFTNRLDSQSPSFLSLKALKQRVADYMQRLDACTGNKISLENFQHSHCHLTSRKCCTYLYSLIFYLVDLNKGSTYRFKTFQTYPPLLDLSFAISLNFKKAKIQRVN